MPDLKVINAIRDRSQPRGDVMMSYNADGTFSDGPTFVSGSDRAIQDVIRGILTRRGTNNLAPNFGTGIKGLLHARSIDDVSSSLTSEVQRTLGYLAQFNLTEDPSERIEELVELRAKQNVDNIELNLTVKTGSGTTASIGVS